LLCCHLPLRVTQDRGLPPVSIVARLLALIVICGPSVALSQPTFGTTDIRNSTIPDVKGLGAVLNGTVNDVSAFTAARTAATNNGTIFVPPGGFDVGGSITGGPASVLWQLSGNGYGAAQTTPVIDVNPGDVTSTYYNGIYFNRSETAQVPATLTVRNTNNFVVSTTGAVSTGQQLTDYVLTIVPAPATSNSYAGNYTYGHLDQLNDSHIGPAQNVASVAYANRPAFSDGFGPRGPIWARFGETIDSSGLPSNLAGAIIGDELDINANDDDPGTAGDGGDRLGLAIGMSSTGLAGAVARFGYGLRLSGGAVTSNNGFWGRAISIQSEWDTAAIDTSQGSPLSINLVSGSAQGSPGVTIPFSNTSGITPGAAVTGTNIAANSVVVSKVANTSVTLNNATTGAVAAGTTLNFNLGFVAPAIRMGVGQILAFDGANKHELFVQNTSGPLFYNVSNVDLFSISDAGGIILNAFAPLSNSATDGFVGLPYTAGVPTGAPSGNTNCEIDVTNGYLNCYYSSAWHKIAFSSGAG
jgi:hypothetical protein